MALTSERKTLGATYVLVFAAAVTEFLAQNVGSETVRVITTEPGAGTPADDAEGSFLLAQKVELTRTGLEGSDVYMRSGSEHGKPAHVTHSPS